MVRRRESPTIRKGEILNAAIELAVKIGYQSITREMVAAVAKTSTGLVTRYFDTMEQLKTEIMKAAIEREIFSIIAQGLSLGDTHAVSINQDLKKRVLEFLSN